MAVTLLFTDIEGSTRLVRELGDTYPAALEEHRRLLRSSVDETNGSEMDCRGDEFAAVFDQPEEAVAAARRILEQHPGPLRVRVGIHTGDPLRVDGSYVGVDVHRTSRICNAGHGGQVLLSETAHAALSEPIDVLDLGPHQLRGLETPEHIYQLDSAVTFPPLRADAAEHGLGARLRVVVADDSVLLREGVARLLDDAGFNVVGQAGDADELLLKVRSYTPDVAIVDIRMPPTHTDEGLQAAKEIRERYPDVGVLVLSQYVESGYALELLQEDANGIGYLLKDRVSDVGEFAAAVKRVAEGGSALDPEVVSRLVGRRRGDDPLSSLTPREREVMELMAEGRSNQAIAERLVVTLRAVEKHVTSIFGKLRLPADEQDHRRVLAVLTYLRD
jgi:DNA-binding NarL/FixJ family response regulator